MPFRRMAIGQVGARSSSKRWRPRQGKISARRSGSIYCIAMFGWGWSRKAIQRLPKKPQMLYSAARFSLRGILRARRELNRKPPAAFWERWRRWALLRSSHLTAVSVLRFSIFPPCLLLPRICNRNSGVIHVPQIDLWDMDLILCPTNLFVGHGWVIDGSVNVVERLIVCEQ